MYLLIKFKFACRNPGSNQGPLDLQSNALPTELFRLIGGKIWIIKLNVLSKTPNETRDYLLKNIFFYSRL